MKQELVKPVIKVGNSAGVLLPREWLNGKAKIELIEKPLNIKKDVLEILDPYLEDIIGIYLVGSYARNEQTKKSDVDILAISEETGRTIISGKYEITIVPFDAILDTLRDYPERIYPKIIDAKAFLNKNLLEKLKEIKFDKDSFKNYISDSKRMIKTGKELIRLDKMEGEVLKSEGVIYSALLRLRALYMIKSVLTDKKYTNKAFRRWILSKLKIGEVEYEKIYEIYRNVRDSKKVKSKIGINIAEKLNSLLEEEIRKYGKKKKKA